MTPTEEDLAFWIKSKYNVLFIGNHGIGKTTLVTNAFKKSNLNHRYFSAATMDPWVDFIGVPKEQEDERGSFLDLVKPKDFRDDTIQALFFDEYNRAPTKVQNAVMELIQFKSINGRKFENLEVVWAAINQSEANKYNVEELDYAQLDRFHIIVQLPNKPSNHFFSNKHGKNGEIICKWWADLSDELKEFISPRRLEYILDVYVNGGDIRACLPMNCNTKTLISNLKDGLPSDKLKELIDSGNESKLKSWLSNASNFSQCEKIIIKDYIETCFPLISMEKQTELLSKHTSIQKVVEANVSEYEELIASLKTSKNKSIKKWASSMTISVVPKEIVDKINKAKWKTPINSKLIREINKRPLAWDTDATLFAGLEIKYDNRLPKIDEAIYSMLPASGYFVTYDKVKNLQSLFKSIAETREMSYEQLEVVLSAINYWTYGMQNLTIDSILNTSRNHLLLEDLMSAYIKKETCTPLQLFTKWEYLFRVCLRLKGKWLKYV